MRLFVLQCLFLRKRGLFQEQLSFLPMMENPLCSVSVLALLVVVVLLGWAAELPPQPLTPPAQRERGRKYDGIGLR